MKHNLSSTPKVSKYIETWIMKDLSPVDKETGFALCPYAKKSWLDDRVKVVSCDGDLWDRVAEECTSFNSKNALTVCIEENPDRSYDELEAACMAMNSYFSVTKQDLWLLVFEGELAIIFIQKLSELDDASQKLEKVGYYENYDPDDYVKLILARRERRIQNGKKS